MDEPTNGSPDETLDDLFERYEALPAQDAEREKRDLVDRIVVAVADRLADVRDDRRYTAVRDATARLRLLAPGADGFDDAVLDLIDAAREAFDPDDSADDRAGVRSPSRLEALREPDDDDVTEASEESFPASDPPGFVADGDGSR